MIEAMTLVAVVSLLFGAIGAAEAALTHDREDVP